MYRMKDRVITIADTIPDAMYMVRFGTVQMSAWGVTKKVGHGTLFGEMAILGLSPTGKRIRTSVALSVCELCVLTKAHFMELISCRPGFFDTLRQVSNMHLATLHYGSSLQIKFGLIVLLYLEP